MIYGYARVSSKEQNLDRQLMELSKYVPRENILTDKASGKDFERDSYKALKGALGLRKGDVLYITSLDRLSRSKEGLKKELAWFKENEITVRILDLPTTLIEVPEGQEWIREMITNILLEVLSSMAEQERITIRKRQAEGIAAAKAKGKHLGRPKLKMPDAFPAYYNEWKAGRITARQAMKAMGLCSSSYYKLVNQYDGVVKSP